MSESIPKSVEIFDDTMREGLQIESPDIPVSEKFASPRRNWRNGRKNHLYWILCTSKVDSFNGVH